MSAEDKHKDFIDKFFDIFEPYQKNGIRFWMLSSIFIILFILGMIIAPVLIDVCVDSFPLKIQIIQISPFEIFFNYLKIALFFDIFLISPFALYQFSKLKVESTSFDNKLNLLLFSSLYTLIIFLSIFLTYKIFFPFELLFLYGLGSTSISSTASLTAIVSAFLVTVILSVLILLMPLLRYLIKKSLFFNYATLIKFKKPIIIYFVILSLFLALPVEFVCLCILFLIFVFWYKILIKFSKKRD